MIDEAELENQCLWKEKEQERLGEIQEMVRNFLPVEMQIVQGCYQRGVFDNQRVLELPLWLHRSTPPGPVFDQKLVLVVPAICF